jgi:aryl-alcohol dehydrogenase-like predicted oxidoreductase
MKKRKTPPLPPGVDPSLYNLPFTVNDFNGMPFRFFGNTGLRVSSVGLGTWKVGYPSTGDGSRVDEKTAFAILDRAIGEGVTFWDTANRYNNASGNSERIIGRWFRKNPRQRRNVELATKVYGTMDGRTPNHCRLSRVNILEATYACLDRLQTDRVEILQFHEFDETTPVEESLMAIEDLIRQDLVRYLGASNFSVDQLEKYAGLDEICRRSRVQSVQNQFDILFGEEDEKRGVLAFCALKKLSFIAWSPLRGGLLSDRYLSKAKVKKGDRLVDEGRLSSELRPAVLKKLQALSRLAGEAGLNLTQLALAYMLQLPGMGPVIAGCSTPEQLVQNAKAGRVRLEKELVESVRRVVGVPDFFKAPA